MKTSREITPPSSHQRLYISGSISAHRTVDASFKEYRALDQDYSHVFIAASEALTYHSGGPLFVYTLPGKGFRIIWRCQLPIVEAWRHLGSSCADHSPQRYPCGTIMLTLDSDTMNRPVSLSDGFWVCCTAHRAYSPAKSPFGRKRRCTLRGGICSHRKEQTTLERKNCQGPFAHQICSEDDQPLPMS